MYRPTSSQRDFIGSCLRAAGVPARFGDPRPGLVDALAAPGLHHDARRLIPLAAEWARQNGCEFDLPELDPRAERLRAIALRRQVLTVATDVIERLSDDGVEVVLLKGLALQHYVEPGMRPVGDIDLLVPFSRWSLAVSCLESCHWTAVDPTDLRHLDARHAASFRHPGLPEVDLHWALNGRLIARPRAHASNIFWKHRQARELGGHRVFDLDPAHKLLHVLVHGAWIESHAPLRWIVDAGLIVGNETALDWDLFQATAQGLEVTLQVEQSLRLVDEILPDHIPPVVLENLTHAPCSLSERLLNWLDGRSVRNPYLLDLQRTFRQHLSLHRDRSLPWIAANYPRALAARGLLVSPLRWARRVRERRLGKR